MLTAGRQRPAGRLQAVPAERIRDWAKEYLALCAEQNFVGEDREALQQELKEAAYERLKWRVLRAFGVLPSEQRAREMTEGDYLYCVMQLTLDEEAALEGLCPGCRAEAMERRCAVCGGTLAEENPQFDEARFEELRRGGLHSDAAADADGAGTGS